MMLKTALVAVALSVLSGAAHAQAAGAVVGSAEAAKAKISMCIGCHAIPGYRSSFPEVYTVPKIAGQNQAYIAAALRAYAKGERTHPTMVAIARQLSEQDIADLSAYYANLK